MSLYRTRERRSHIEVLDYGLLTWMRLNTEMTCIIVDMIHSFSRVPVSVIAVNNLSRRTWAEGYSGKSRRK